MIEESSYIINLHRGCGSVVVPLVLLFVQVIIVRDSTHGDAEKQDARKPSDAAERPNFLPFHNARRKTHATPGQPHDAYQLGIPGHQIEMTFSPDFAPDADNGDQRDEELHGVGQAQPRWI
jgi:hypothetical protein